MRSPRRIPNSRGRMKKIAFLVFGIICVVGASLGVGSVASVIEPRKPPSLMPSASELWTATPVKIDRASQSFERLPALLSTYASSPIRVANANPSMDRKIEPTTLSDSVPAMSAQYAQHIEWCASRYRSFDEKTNTYRSFSGRIKTCSSPFGGHHVSLSQT